MLHNGSASSLALVREISNNHANIQQLLDSEHEVIGESADFGRGTFNTKNVFLGIIITVDWKPELKVLLF